MKLQEQMNSQKVHSALTPYFSRTRGVIKPGVHRMQLLLTEEINKGTLDLPCVLITGTNGKGSVCAMLESALRHAGVKTGLYTSPHLVHPAERIRINGRPIEETELERIVEELNSAKDRFLPDATFFELTTAAALIAFARARVDFVVMEVGLGGRFDSTNVVNPLVSVLTSVAVEHVEYLGNTEEQIASDKAFVSRRNRPLVCGSLSYAAQCGVSGTLKVTGAITINAREPLPPLFETLCEHLLTSESPWLRLNGDNVRTAVAALSFLAEKLGLQGTVETYARGFFQTFWPGRFDVRTFRGRAILFDAGHNPAGVAYFLKQFASSKFANQKAHVLFGVLADKRWDEMLPLLSQIAHAIILTQPTNQRAVSAEELAAHANSAVPVECIPNLREAVEKVLLCDPEDPIVITGSISLIGEIMELLGIEPFE